MNTLEGRNKFLLVGSKSQYLISATQKSVRVIQEFPASLMIAGLLDVKLLAVVVKYVSEQVCIVKVVLLPYSGLILKGENFKVFPDFALSSKF